MTAKHYSTEPTAHLSSFHAKLARANASLRGHDMFVLRSPDGKLHIATPKERKAHPQDVLLETVHPDGTVSCA